MLYTIKNEALQVVIDNHGAELHSIQMARSISGRVIRQSGTDRRRICFRMWPG